MVRATRGVVIINEFSSSLQVFSLNNGIPKASDWTGNEYNSLSFSEIVSPIITSSKKCHQPVSLDRSFLAWRVKSNKNCSAHWNKMLHKRLVVVILQILINFSRLHLHSNWFYFFLKRIRSSYIGFCLHQFCFLNSYFCIAKVSISS